MDQKAIIVLGMHRSGTSAIMRVVNLLGVDIGDDLLEAGPDNLSGFWEHTEIFRLHGRILKLLNRSWHDIRPLPEKWWKNDEILMVKDQIIDVIKKDFSEAEIWGVKDPRMCKLLPLWNLIFEELNIKPYFIHIIRNPYEVKASLGKRNEFPVSKSLLLWLEHILEAEKDTRGHPRIFITYDQLLENWSLTVDMISEKFGIKWPEKMSDISDKIDDFLSPVLRHHNLKAEIEGSNDFLWINKIYDVLVNESQGRDVQLIETFSGIYDEFNKEMRSFIVDAFSDELNMKNKMFEEEIKKGERAIIGLEEMIERRDKSIIKRDKIIEMYKNSISFRVGRVITSPGRWAKNLFITKK